jgi:hypothetical protein
VTALIANLVEILGDMAHLKLDYSLTCCQGLPTTPPLPDFPRRLVEHREIALEGHDQWNWNFHPGKCLSYVTLLTKE